MYEYIFYAEYTLIDHKSFKINWIYRVRREYFLRVLYIFSNIDLWRCHYYFQICRNDVKFLWDR